MDIKQSTKRIKELVSESRIDEAFELLEELVDLTKHKDLENDLFTIKGRRNQQKQKEINGTIDDDAITINNSINISIINFTDRVEKIAQETIEVNSPKRNHRRNNILILFGGLILGGLIFLAVSYINSPDNHTEKLSEEGENKKVSELIIKIDSIQNEKDKLESEVDSMQNITDKNKSPVSAKNTAKINKIKDKIKKNNKEIISLKTQVTETKVAKVKESAIKPPSNSKITIQHDDNPSARAKAIKLKEELKLNNQGIPIDIEFILNRPTFDQNTICYNPKNSKSTKLLEYILSVNVSEFNINNSRSNSVKKIHIYIKS
ncbi:MAG: hypothetical protein AB8H03_23200 [Saprospiraceae bacterium]